jgi:anaerobic selenocysteine-containing dehydrogenase
VDPRPTPVARHAALHLAPLPGTNVALMNGLLHEILAHDWVDHDYVERHTVGYEELHKRVADFPPARVAAICRIDAADLRRAA